MKKNKMMRIASVLLVAVLLSTCAISGTFAKYVTTETGSAIAQVAKWNVEIVETGESSFAFDLFETILDSDGINGETDVVTGKIAPGTSGKFSISLYAKSEVTTDYIIDYTVTKTNASLPIKFSVNGGTTWTDDLADVAGQLAVNAEYDEDITVQWKWDIGDNSGSDNVYGDGATSVTVAVSITFEQVD
jgi:hypothetical protein